MLIEPQPKELIRFKRATHAVYTAYSLSNYGMYQLGEDIKKHLGKDIKKMDFTNLEGVFQIGSSDLEKEALSEMKTKDVLLWMEKNGPFSQLIGHGLIVWIFAYWEELYRGKIADEIGVVKNRIMSDVMGDIRIIRNSIVHNNGIVNKDFKKLKIFTWIKAGEPILITTEEMMKIQKALNTMQVYLT